MASTTWWTTTTTRGSSRLTRLLHVITRPKSHLGMYNPSHPTHLTTQSQHRCSLLHSPHPLSAMFRKRWWSCWMWSSMCVNGKPLLGQPEGNARIPVTLQHPPSPRQLPYQPNLSAHSSQPTPSNHHLNLPFTIQEDGNAYTKGLFTICL